MEDLMNKYADVILQCCLKVKKDESLYIFGPAERIDFIRILVNKAYKMGVYDIKLQIEDAYIKHEQLLNLSYEQLKKIKWWNGSLADAAKVNAAVLRLDTEYPSLYDDVDNQKLAKLTKSMMLENSSYYDKVNKNEISWCIAAVPSSMWAQKLFGNDEKATEKLWDLIFEICCIKGENPKQSLLNTIDKLHYYAEKLNSLNIKFFEYHNTLGTNLRVYMPKDYVFNNIEMKLQDGRIVYPNLPSLEVYSSPDFRKTTGTVFSSKPLVYHGKIIDKFYLKFENGKVVDYDAKKGYELLKEIIEFSDTSSYLGEIAFVNYDSAISNKNILFYTTLYDENASCHLALGQSFADALKGGVTKDKEELFELGLNQCKEHVDFMIGTQDLTITATDINDKEILIFKNGNFCL